MSARRLSRLSQHFTTRAAAVRRVDVLSKLWQRRRRRSTLVRQRREDPGHESETLWTRKRGSGRRTITSAHTVHNHTHHGSKYGWGYGLP